MTAVIQPPDRHHLLAAQGWLELGNLHEATAELDQMSPEFNQHPAVLEVRWQLHARAKEWVACVGVAAALIQSDPTSAAGWIHRSYALHELQRTLEARDGLLSVVNLFPDEMTICYNLACYECRLGNATKARHWLGKLFDTEHGAQWKAAALVDTDLKPLWTVIANL